MPKNQGVNEYKEMSVLSAKPEQLILMLYDGALRFLRQAIKNLEEKNLEPAHNNLIRAQNILTELIASLNFDKGGEIAMNLFRIYEFMHYTLVQANVKKDPEPARKIHEQLITLRDSWAAALKNQRQPGEAAKASGASGPAEPERGLKKKSIELTG
ncbi:MAG: flagellar export chaperone FliS [Candidatus Glassbacteria bacterium]|nr:flagellar export chaperone FliS [Candidatus Glassbacteria bacterium]